MNIRNQYRLDQVLFWMVAVFYVNGNLFLYGFCLIYLLFQTLERISFRFSISRMICLCMVSFVIMRQGLSSNPLLWIWIILHSAWLESYQREDFFFYFPLYIGFVFMAIAFDGIEGTTAWIQLLFCPGLLISCIRKVILKGKTQRSFLLFKH